MSKILADDKEILVLCGCCDATPIRFEDVSLQLYDVEEKKWYKPLLMSAGDRNFERSDSFAGIVGSELYFYAQLTPRDPPNDEPVEDEAEDEPIDEGGETEGAEESEEYLRSCHCLDFSTKKITYVGEFPFLENPQIVIDDLIYSVANNVPCLNTKTKSISKNPDELKVYYANYATVLYNGCIIGIQECLEDFCDFALISHNMSTKENTILRRPPLVEDNLTMTLFNDKLYAIEDSNLKNLYIYTPELDEWETVETSDPPVILCGRLIVCNGRLLCVEENYRIYEYDLDKKEWNLQCNDYKGPITIRLTNLTIKKALVTSWE